jgi:hypothetical protein
MAPKAAKSPKPRRKQRTGQAQRSATKNASSRARPMAPTGIEIIDDDDDEPGMPDSVDVAETARPMSPDAAKSTELAGGDLDAGFAGLDSGEEAVGGSDPLPDQSVVDDIGRALGVEEQDEKPLATTEKIEARDRERWELDPASADDYELRIEEEAAERRRPRRPRRPAPRGSA